MSVETSIYTRQPAMSGDRLRGLAESHGLAIRFLDYAGMPLEPGVRLDEPMYGQGYVVIGWSAADADTSEAIDRALQEGCKPVVDRLGMEGKLGWCSIYCREFDFVEYEKLLREDLEEDGVADEEPAPAEVLERMRGARTEYSFRCGTRPRQCSDLLGKLADLILEATDGFLDE